MRCICICVFVYLCNCLSVAWPQKSKIDLRWNLQHVDEVYAGRFEEPGWKGGAVGALANQILPTLVFSALTHANQLASYLLVLDSLCPVGPYEILSGMKTPPCSSSSLHQVLQSIRISEMHNTDLFCWIALATGIAKIEALLCWFQMEGGWRWKETRLMFILWFGVSNLFATKNMVRFEAEKLDCLISLTCDDN